jgi:hypothetical protein
MQLGIYAVKINGHCLWPAHGNADVFNEPVLLRNGPGTSFNLVAPAGSIAVPLWEAASVSLDHA